MLSVIIPSRSPDFLQITVDNLLEKSEGEVEVIVVLDGIWPDPIIRDDPRVSLIHQGEVHNNVGMRGAINAGVRLARGEYIMKIDEHCMLDQGYDLKLIADCESNWVVIPRRKRLNPETWELIEDGRPPIDYMFLDYPYQREFDKTCGLHGAEDKQRYYDRQDVLVDDVMTMQGSCYFMPKQHWETVIQALDDEHYGTFTQEAQEVSMKTWLSGGRVVVNKNTWYAHYHKGKRGKGYGFSNEQYKKHMEGTERGRRYCIDYWVNNKWPEAQYDFGWLVAKFWPLKGWPEHWQEQIQLDQASDYAALPPEKQKDWYAHNT